MNFAKDEPPPTDDEILAALTKVVILSGEAISTASPKVVRSYYTEKHAVEVARLIEKLHSTRVPLRIIAKHYSVNTHRLQYYQGAQYLIDHDKTGKWAVLYRATVLRLYDDYVELHIRRNSRRALAEQATQASPWWDDFIRFLDESHPGEKLHRPDVTLSDEDIARAYNQIADIDSIFPGKFTEHEVLVVHLSREDNEDNTNDNQSNEGNASDLPAGDPGETT